MTVGVLRLPPPNNHEYDNNQPSRIATSLCDGKSRREDIVEMGVAAPHTGLDGLGVFALQLPGHQLDLGPSRLHPGVQLADPRLLDERLC